MKKITGFLSHLSICFSLALLTLVILDGRNPMMKFLNSNASKVLIIIACAVIIISSLLSLIADKGSRKE